MKKYKITEEQYSRLLKEINGEEDIDIAPPITKKVRDIPPTPEIIDDLPEPLETGVEDKDMSIKEKLEFLEDFFRDIVDFIEFFTKEVDSALIESSEGNVDISEVLKRLEKLTTRSGRKRFYVSKRGLR